MIVSRRNMLKAIALLVPALSIKSNAEKGVGWNNASLSRLNPSELRIEAISNTKLQFSFCGPDGITKTFISELA